MKKLIILIVILVVGYLVLDKFYPQILQKFMLKKEFKNETGEWKIFDSKNEGFVQKFTIKYPKNWYLDFFRRSSASNIDSVSFLNYRPIIGMDPTDACLIQFNFIGDVKKPSVSKSNTISQDQKKNACDATLDFIEESFKFIE